MNWKIAQAQQKFAELIEAATQEPQLIYHQKRLVAAVVEAELFQEFLAWRERCQQSSIADVFGELRQLAQEEDYILEISSRQDRPNLFAEQLNEISM